MRPERIPPGPGQESVWDYPRPPRIDPSSERVRVEFAGRTVAETTRALRVLETSGAPVYYIPPADVDLSLLKPVSGGPTLCEWKGRARYHDLVVGDRSSNRAAWSYADPTPDFVAIKDHVAFYAGRVDGCFVNDERVIPQPGDFYGGWVTSRIVGSFKGNPGSQTW